MYYSLFQSIKTEVAKSLGLVINDQTGKVSNPASAGLQDIQWFNAQYDGIIHIAPALFVEFAPLVINRQTKQTNTTEISIRLHVVSQTVGESDGDVPDSDVGRHEDLAGRILEALEDKPLLFLEDETRPLRLAGWTHHHKYKGWMVTLIDLKTKG